MSLTLKDGGTLVKVTHGGLGSGKAWAKMVKETETSWPKSLENLASALETGQDLRYVLQPMLGITGGSLDAEIAAKLGVPTADGARLDGVVEGMGAAAAGLQKDDVIVAIAGKKVASWYAIGPAVQKRRAGDKVPVVFYRGGEVTAQAAVQNRALRQRSPPSATGI